MAEPMTGRPALGQIEAIVFDFDGVIANSMGMQEQAWRVVTQDDPELQRRIVENLYAGRAGETMFDGTDLTDGRRDQLRRSKDTLWDAARSEVALMAGAASAIPRLGGKFPLGLATSADRPYVESLLQREGLISYFRVLMTNADVPNPKPAPDMLVAAASQLEVELRKVLMIGDTDADRQLAANAGTQFLRFGSARPDVAGVQSVSGWPELEVLLLG
ncbi:MAG TPA: HAD-IA family hydrolase [Coriobacteriia bacterium]|nr:HAD-IA family hydrolase [Coriobacteriia bacterium]